jgi:hypothetical protein
MYVKFNMSFIGYERAYIKDAEDYKQNTNIDTGDFPNWKEVLAKHNIKGYFFVRQKRIPMTIAQGLVIGLSDKDHGALPVLKSIDNKYIGQSFLGADRLIYSEGRTFKLPRNKTEKYSEQAMLVPDAEMHLATYNQLFTSADFCLQTAYDYTFNQKDDSTKHFLDRISLSNTPTSYIAKLTNVPDGTTSVTNGADFFSAKAGSAEEAFKTEDYIYSFN